MPEWSFINYVDKILAFFYHLPPSVDIFYVPYNGCKKPNFLAQYLPLLVNVVFERPLILILSHDKLVTIVKIHECVSPFSVLDDSYSPKVPNVQKNGETC